MKQSKDFPNIDTAQELLEAECEKLPAEVFRELNGGVNLLPDVRRSADGLYTLGQYHHNAMGSYIEIFYGSMRAVHPDADEKALGEYLGATLRHELTHHVERLAGDRSLEKWDEQHRAELLRGFYDDDVSTASFAGGQYRRVSAPLLHRRRPVSPSEEEA